jgi:autotransporter translocation and assembly factor TamB
MKKIERVQTGLRIEKRLLKVLKGLGEHLEMPVAEIVEGIALHAFEGKAPFSPETLEKIAQLKAVYDLDLTAADAHRLSEDAS